MKKRRVVFALIIVATYIAALLLPVVEIEIRSDESPHTFFGHEAIGVPSSFLAAIPQLANIALPIGIVLLFVGRKLAAMLAAVFGSLCAISAPLLYEIYLNDLRIAYYLWLSCPIMLGVASFIESKRNTDTALTQAEPSPPRNPL